MSEVANELKKKLALLTELKALDQKLKAVEKLKAANAATGKLVQSIQAKVAELDK